MILFKEMKSSCVICYEKRDLLKLKICVHSFCKECLFQWTEKSRTCPVCRCEMNIENWIMTRQNVKLFRKYILRTIVDYFEDDDLFSLPEIIKLYEKMHQNSYSIYQTKDVNEIILSNNKRIREQLKKSIVMNEHRDKVKLERLLDKSNELCKIYSVNH